METRQPKRYWFYAKSSGWGWGLPCAWQGWVVFLGWIGLFTATAVLLATTVWLFVPAAILLAAGLFAVAWWKGEPARWRWGTQTGPRLRDDERWD